MAKNNKVNSLQDLSSIVDVKPEVRDEYTTKRYNWRTVISNKNRKWFEDKENVNNFDLSKYNMSVYQMVKKNFEDEKTRNWMIHLATNFLPLDVPSQCPILPSERYFCKISGQELTDSLRIKTGDRNKAIGYVGLNSSIILSSVAIVELHRYVLENIIEFDTKIGHIVNHAFDILRLKETED